MAIDVSDTGNAEQAKERMNLVNSNAAWSKVIGKVEGLLGFQLDHYKHVKLQMI